MEEPVNRWSRLAPRRFAQRVFRSRIVSGEESLLAGAIAAEAPVSGADAEARRRLHVGYVYAAIAAFLFAAKGVLVKLAYEHGVDASTILALRLVIALPVYLVIGWLSIRDRIAAGRPMPARQWLWRAALLGVIGNWLASYLDFWGLQYISAQLERVILFTYPLFVVVIGTWFFGLPMSRRALAASLISYVGLFLIFGETMTVGGSAPLFGAFLIVGSAICFALYQLMAKPIITELGPRFFTALTIGAATVIACAQFLIEHPTFDVVINGPVLFYAFLIAIFATVIPFFLLASALERISAQANATIGMASPVGTIILAWIVLGETLTPIGVAGTALIIGGIGWFTLTERK